MVEWPDWSAIRLGRTVAPVAVPHRAPDLTTSGMTNVVSVVVTAVVVRGTTAAQDRGQYYYCKGSGHYCYAIDC